MTTASRWTSWTTHQAGALACSPTNGVRIEEALATTVANYTYQRGHRVLRIIRKGGKAATAPLNPITVRALDTYLQDGHPLTGWLFLNRDRTAKLAYTSAFQMIQRLACNACNACIPAAAQITPHSLRHSFRHTFFRQSPYRHRSMLVFGVEGRSRSRSQVAA